MDRSRIPFQRQSLERFCRRYQVQRLALFGSVLRDDYRPDSDIDILVTFQPNAKITFLTLGKMKRELSGMFQRSVDLVPQDGLKPAIREAVLSSAEELYAV
jgi:predicted nucleotidyltransferase